jgi:ribonuclease BN (tRNA processing enzyme)
MRAIVQYLEVNSDIRVSEGTQTQPVQQMVASHVVGTGVVYRDANVTVSAVENAHFHFPPGSRADGRFKSYAYRFESAGRTIVFTGDTGPSDAVTELAQGADILVSEISSPDEARERRIKNGDWERLSPAEQKAFMRHMTEEHVTSAEVGQMAQRAGVKKVVLTHILATAEPKDDYARYAEGVRKYFSGDVVIAHDLMEF